MSESGRDNDIPPSEPANLLANAMAIGIVPWTCFNTTVMPGYGAPDGSPTAVLLVEDYSIHQHDIRQEFGPVVDGAVYSLSCYCRAGTRYWVHMVLWDHGQSDSGGTAWFDLSAGKIGTTSLFGRGSAHLDTRIEDVGNGWYRCELACRVSMMATRGAYTAQIQLATSDGNRLHAGDGVSGVQLWSPHVGRVNNPAVAVRTQANVLSCSSMIGTLPWEPVGTAVTAGYASPDGEAHAVRLRESADGGEHGVYQSVVEVLPGQPYTFSCFCKASFRGWVRLVLWDEGTTNSGASAWYDLTQGSLGTMGLFGDDSSELVAWMEGVGNGWYRCIITCVVNRVAATRGYTAQIQIAPMDGVSRYDGDGDSGILVWGAQLEQRRMVRPLLPTGDQAATDPSPETLSMEPGGRWLRVNAGRDGDALNYGHNPGGLNNQKLALLGLFLKARQTGIRKVVLPSFYIKDPVRDNGRAVPFDTVFDAARLHDFAARHEIEIVPDGPRNDGGGWEYFGFATHWLDFNTWARNLGPDDFCCDFLRALQPHMGASPLLKRLRETVFHERHVQVVLQLRVELDWVRYTSEALVPSHSAIEEPELSFATMMRKTRESLPASQSGIFVTCDEAYLPFGRTFIRDVVKEDLGIDLVFKSELLTSDERRGLSRLDLSLLDFEMAVAAPFYVGQSRSTFSNLVGLERYARSRSPVTNHYIYNVKGRGLGQRADNGAYCVPDQVIARRQR